MLMKMIVTNINKKYFVFIEAFWFSIIEDINKVTLFQSTCNVIFKFEVDHK